MVDLTPNTFSNGTIADATKVDAVIDAINSGNSYSQFLTLLQSYDSSSLTSLTTRSQLPLIINNNYYNILDTLHNGSFIIGSSNTKQALFSKIIDFKPTYEDFTSGIFPNTKAGSYVSNASITSNDTTYGSYCMLVTTNNVGTGSVVFNQSGSSLTVVYPGSNIEIGIDMFASLSCNDTGGTATESSTTYIELRERTLGSVVTIYSDGTTGAFVSSSNYTRRDKSITAFINMIYNGLTGSFITRNTHTQTTSTTTPTYSPPTYIDSLSTSTGSIFSGSWDIQVRTVTNTTGQGTATNKTYINRITKLGSDIGSSWAVFGPITLNNNIVSVKSSIFGYTRDLGSISLMLGRTDSSFPITNSGDLTGAGSSIYIKLLGTYSGSFDTTCLNAPFVRGFGILTDCTKNKW